MEILKNLLLSKVLPAVLGVGFALTLLLVTHLTVQNANLRAAVSAEQVNSAKLRTELADERANSAAQLVKAQQENRDREVYLAQLARQDKERSNETIADLERRAAALSLSLRTAREKQQSADAAMPKADHSATAGKAPQVGDGNPVPARIGETDVAEALRADRIRVELLRCYAAYDRVRDTLLQPQPQGITMEIHKRLEELGVESVGGTLMKGQKELGHVRNGVIVLTPEGEALMAVEDAVVKTETKVETEVTQTPQKAVKKKNAQAAKTQEPIQSETPQPTEQVVAEAPPVADLDKLLGE